MRPVLKICGLMRETDVAVCAAAGVDIVGFVCEYPVPVPWNLERARAKELLSGIAAPVKSCIVTGGGFDRIYRLADALRPAYVQLHYREDIELTARLVNALSPIGVQVIKTLPHDAAQRLAQFGTQQVDSCVRMLVHAGVAAILCDARTPENAGQTNLTADTTFYARVKDAAEIPVLLAGGITVENAGTLLSAIHPDGIDVMTGVERRPGEKDAEKIAALVRRIR